MARLPRKTQQIFGGSLAAAGNIAVFGSLAASAPNYSLDLATIQSLPAFANAWAAALINTPGGNASPALQDMNALFYLLTTQIAYLMQSGVAEWDSATTYFTGNWVLVSGVGYVSKTDNNQNNNPVTDVNNWQTLASSLTGGSLGVCQAWVNFAGNGPIGNQTIYRSFNVSNVSKSSPGVYMVNFTTPMPNAMYAWSGSVGTGGSGFTNGDDNYLTNGAPGQVSTKTASQLSIFCYDRVNSYSEDSQNISVMVFSAP